MFTFESRITTLPSLISQGIEGRLMSLHTCLPGVVQSFDPALQTVTVQATIKKRVGGTDVALPLLSDCPVVYPQGGGYVLTFPLQQGDEVLIIFSERAIDQWYALGGVQKAEPFRLHSLSDGFVIPGVSNKTRVVSSLQTDRVSLRSRSGSTEISIKGGDVEIKATSIKITGTLEVTGSIKATDNIESVKKVIGKQDVEVGPASKSLLTHTHTSTAPGSPTSPPL